MPFGFATGQLVGLVRHAHSLERRRSAVAVGGPGAATLAAGLSAGGDPSAIAVDGQPTRAAAAVWLVDGASAPAAFLAIRQAVRSGIPVVAVRRHGPVDDVAAVHPTEVLDVDDREIPVEKVAAALATALDGDDAISLAARLPALRGAVERRLVRRTALLNAAIAAAPWVRQAHMPLLTLAQARMLLELDVAEGKRLPDDPRELVVAAGPALAASLGTGLGLRALYRRSPFRGPLVAAALAYAGTRGLAALRSRLSP